MMNNFKKTILIFTVLIGVSCLFGFSFSKVSNAFTLCSDDDFCGGFKEFPRISCQKDIINKICIPNTFGYTTLYCNPQCQLGQDVAVGCIEEFDGNGNLIDCSRDYEYQDGTCCINDGSGGTGGCTNCSGTGEDPPSVCGNGICEADEDASCSDCTHTPQCGCYDACVPSDDPICEDGMHFETPLSGTGSCNKDCGTHGGLYCAYPNWNECPQSNSNDCSTHYVILDAWEYFDTKPPTCNASNGECQLNQDLCHTTGFAADPDRYSGNISGGEGINVEGSVYYDLFEDYGTASQQWLKSGPINLPSWSHICRLAAEKKWGEDMFWYYNPICDQCGGDNPEGNGSTEDECHHRWDVTLPIELRDGQDHNVRMIWYDFEKNGCKYDPAWEATEQCTAFDNSECEAMQIEDLSGNIIAVRGSGVTPTLEIGEDYVVKTTFKNNGSKTWDAGNNGYRLAPNSDPLNGIKLEWNSLNPTCSNTNKAECVRWYNAFSNTLVPVDGSNWRLFSPVAPGGTVTHKLQFKADARESELGTTDYDRELSFSMLASSTNHPSYDRWMDPYNDTNPVISGEYCSMVVRLEYGTSEISGTVKIIDDDATCTGTQVLSSSSSPAPTFATGNPTLHAYSGATEVGSYTYNTSTGAFSLSDLEDATLSFTATPNSLPTTNAGVEYEPYCMNVNGTPYVFGTPFTIPVDTDFSNVTFGFKQKNKYENGWISSFDGDVYARNSITLSDIPDTLTQAPLQNDTLNVVANTNMDAVVQYGQIFKDASDNAVSNDKIYDANAATLLNFMPSYWPYPNEAVFTPPANAIALPTGNLRVDKVYYTDTASALDSQLKLGYNVNDPAGTGDKVVVIYYTGTDPVQIDTGVRPNGGSADKRLLLISSADVIVNKDIGFINENTYTSNYANANLQVGVITKGKFTVQGNNDPNNPDDKYIVIESPIVAKDGIENIRNIGPLKNAYAPSVTYKYNPVFLTSVGEISGLYSSQVKWIIQ